MAISVFHRIQPLSLKQPMTIDSQCQWLFFQLNLKNIIQLFTSLLTIRKQF